MAIYLPVKKNDPWQGLRTGLMEVLSGWQKGMEKQRERQDLTLVSRVLEQANVNPERGTELFAEALSRMQTPGGKQYLTGLMSQYMKPETLQLVGPGQQLYSQRKGKAVFGVSNKPTQPTQYETWGKARRARKNDPYGFQPGTVYQISNRGNTQVRQKPLTGGAAGETGKQIVNYTKAINQTLKKYGVNSGITISPEGNIDVAALLEGKKAAYEKIQQKAQQGDQQAIADLSKLNYWYGQIDQLTGIGTPGYKKSSQQTQQGLIQYDYVPGKGLVRREGK